MATNSDLSIARKVHFFRVTHAAEVLGLLPASMTAINQLPWEGQGRYQSDNTDNSLLSVLPHSFDYPLRLEFGRTRRDNLPAIERKGVKQTLSIAEDAGLIDVCHIVLFKDGIVAAEYNRDAPRIRKLGDYLYFKGRNLPTAPRFQRLFERDIADVIRTMDSVKFLELEIPPESIALVRQADRSLADAFTAQQRVNNARTLGLYFNARDPSDSRLKLLGLSLVGAMRGLENEGAFEKLEIRGTDPHTGRARVLNLLEDFLLAEVNFIRSSKKARSIDSNAAFAAIEDAYVQRQEALRAAAGATTPWD